MKKFFLIFAVLFSVRSFSQVTPRFLLYGVKEGLSQNSAHAIFRDREGLVWIGTQDGLNSFDGKNFTVYRHSDDDSTTISDQFILKITQDQNGLIWIGTRNGLNSFDKHSGKFRRYYCTPGEQHTFQSQYTNFSICDRDILAINDVDLYMIDIASGRSKKAANPDGKNGNWFPGTFYKAWFLDENGRLFFYPDIRRNTFKEKAKISIAGANLRHCMADFIGDSLLVLTNTEDPNRIFIYNVAPFGLRKEIVLPPGFSHAYIAGPDEIYLFSDKEIYRTDIFGHTVKLYGDAVQENGLPRGAVLTVYRDDEANLWIGTSGNGVAVTNHFFDHYQLVKSPVPGDVVTSVTKNGSDYYIGSRSGLWRMNKTGGQGFASVLPDKIITALAVDAGQNIWAGIAHEGIIVLNKSGRVIKKIHPGRSPAADVVMSLLPDSKGNMLISTTKGFFVAHTADTTVTAFMADDPVRPIRGNYVMSAFEDRQKNTWIANNYGLDVFDEHFSKKMFFESSGDQGSFIKRTIVTSATQDKAGAIWISTIRNGIYKYDKGKVAHYTVSSGLASDVVYNLVCDERNRIWATTGAGLNIFNASRNDFSTMTSLDGVPATGFIFGAVYKDGDKILFGTSEGLLVCSASDVVLHETAIRAYVSGIKVNGSAIPVRNDAFEVMADDKLISFELSSAPAFFSGNIIYQYRLSGQQEDWITLPEGIHTVSYNGLPYKNLSMQVRAAGSANNLETAAVSVISIKSKAPFLKTTAFAIGAAILFILLVILFVAAYNRRRYKKQSEQLKTERGLQNERIRIGRDLHDNIGAYTSALIAGINRIEPSDQEQLQQISDLKEYGAGIMGFLRETIWMLNSETLTVTAFADRFKNYTLRISRNYPGIDFQFNEHITREKTLPPALMLNLFRILQEALQNSCKHSGASLVVISVNSEESLFFEISDNGSGFDEAEKTDHYGLGNMKKRADESGLAFFVKSSAGGTVVHVGENTANAALENTDLKV